MKHLSRRAAPLLSIAFVAGLLGACGLLRTAAETPARMAEAVMPGKKPGGPPIELLLADVMRYSDLIVLRVEEASRDFASAVGTPEAEIQAASWRLETLRWATQLPAGPNSLTSLLDLVAISTSSRWMHEDYWIPEVWGEPDRPLLAAMEQIEQDGWVLMERYLTEPQVAEAREVLRAWREQNPRVTRRSLLEFPSFVSLAQAHGKSDSESTGLLGMVGLDPLSGLEPAARQVELARQFGQRALFFIQRAPRLVSAQIQLDVLQARRSAEVQGVLGDLARVTRTLEEFGAFTAALPEHFRVEREAAVRQVSEELTSQRAGLVQDLETAQAPLTTMLAESRQTLVAAEHMSVELAEAVRALDSFVGRFDKEPEPESAPPPEPEEPSKPFDITEYGASAERIGTAARELTALIAEVDASLPEVERLVDVTARRGEQGVDRLLRNGLFVGLALIAAVSLAVVLVRRPRPSA